MRRALSLAAAAVAALGVVVAAESPGAGAARQGHPPTQITVVRPVNAAGFAVSNYTVQSDTSLPIECSSANPAPSAVSPNIEQCSPTLAPPACWKAAAPHKALCLTNPRARKLLRLPRHGAFAPTGLAPASERAPLSMALANGDYCTFRTGGTGGIRLDHPKWTATYNCNSGKMVWMRRGAHHYGVNEQLDSWVVIVAGVTGPIFARYLTRAWFVGTYHAA